MSSISDPLSGDILAMLDEPIMYAAIISCAQSGESIAAFWNELMRESLGEETAERLIRLLPSLTP